MPLGRWSAKIKKKGIKRIYNCTYDSDVEVAISYDRMADIIYDDRDKLKFSYAPLFRGLAGGCALVNNRVDHPVLEVGVVVHTT